MVAESIVSDGDIDLRDEYRDRVWRDWGGAPLRPAAGLTNGRYRRAAGVRVRVARGARLRGSRGGRR